MKQKILLVQPRHNYAPPFSEKSIGHIYLPTSLLTIGAILLDCGIEVEFVDENLVTADLSHNLVGINLLGAPYIPIAIDFEKRLRQKFGIDFTLLLGGQVVSGLSIEDMKSLFSNQTLNGNDPKNICNIFKIPESKLPKKENVSLIKSFELLDDAIFKLYLQKEFSFYLSQGCRFQCSFCAATRTIVKDGKKTSASEVYRNIDLAMLDFEYLLRKSVEYGINKIEVYLSNLDLFQSPQKLKLFADGILNLRKKYGSVNIILRGLSTCNSFLHAHRTDNSVIKTMVEAGLERIGFGIDGATQKVYLKTRKPQKVKDTLSAIHICKEEYNITPEALMVFGHNNSEDEESLKLAVKFCKDMNALYGAYPRPHIAKDIVPGNDGWFDKNNKKVKEEFYSNPLLFQNLDFTATPSPITHPDQGFRNMVTKYYKMVCELPNSLTQYVLPELPDLSVEELARVRLYNMEKYDI